MRIANAVALLFFVAWGAFQHNDPDALAWAGVYGAAVIHCVLFALGRFPRPLALAYMALCLVWAGILLGSFMAAGEGAFSETAREAYGLLICAGWVFVLYRRSG